RCQFPGTDGTNATVPVPGAGVSPMCLRVRGSATQIEDEEEGRARQGRDTPWGEKAATVLQPAPTLIKTAVSRCYTRCYKAQRVSERCNTRGYTETSSVCNPCV